MNELNIYLTAADIHYNLSMDDTLTEEQQDVEYGYFWDSVNRAAELIVKFTNGQIDEMTAKRMVAHKRPEILAIINR